METNWPSSPTTAPSSTPATFRRSVTIRASRSTIRAGVAKRHLPSLEEMAPRGDPVHSRINLFTPNSDWITYHTVVSTSGNQIAIAPGYLATHLATGMAATIYEYSMGATHILDFYAYLSGRYKTRKEALLGTQRPRESGGLLRSGSHLRHRRHARDVRRAGLDYYQAHYSPYQFTQYRIMEFPRYRSSRSPSRTPCRYSEGIGFIEPNAAQETMSI